jgi:hypothetical protein
MLFPKRTAAPRAQELDMSEYGCAALVPQALAQPSMPRLRLLHVFIENGDGLSDGSFKPLWAAPWFPQLQDLSLSTDQGFGGPGLAPLRAAPLLRKLCIRKFGSPALTADDGRALAAAALPALRELQIHNIESGFVAALAAAAWLGQIESLAISGGGEGPVGGLAAADGRALAAAPLPPLKRLEIEYMEPGFMAACAAAAWLSHLTCLELRGGGGLPTGGGGLLEGSPAWAASPFTALVSLTLGYRRGVALPSEASRWAALVAAPWFGRLQQLHLERWPLGSAGRGDGAGLRALAAAPLPNLTSLSLYGSNLSAADVSGVLSRAPWLAALTSLALAFNNLGAPGHRALSLLHLPRLRALSLDRNGFDCAAMAALVSAPWLTQLTELALTEVTFASPQSHADERRGAAVEDDAWVFGRLRRRGCKVDVHMVNRTADPSGNDDEMGSDGEPAGSDPGSDQDDG